MIESIRCLDVPGERTREDLRRHGLRVAGEEIVALARRLERDPTVAEAFLIDVAYSELCSYKS
ncbi:MAG: hypothetical protein GF346_09760, partial [Candidatus Eisenbacteria bacterium]|nr:hypothetical protein [Candidatus Latescibacterota bacterium]MBD3302719.1 hypothetical protein [Candidatus Eisenbacteria bacterium]